MNQSKNNMADRVRSLHIEHPKMMEIFNHLDAIRVHQKYQAKSRHLFIIGESGVGKTTMADHYIKKNVGPTVVGEDGTEYDLKPVIYVETPHPFTFKEFYYAILKGLGAPRIPGKPEIGEIKVRVLTLLNDLKVEMIIFDEIHHILRSTSVNPEAAMENVKHISNVTNVSLVLMGTETAKQLRGVDEQHKTRYRLKVMKRFQECDEEFCYFLKEVENQIAPPRPIGLGDKITNIPQLLFYLCKGRLGYLIPILQEAYRISGLFDGNGEVDLSLETLEEAYKIILGDVEDELEDIG